jgi:hypothetical protein
LFPHLDSGKYNTFVDVFFSTGNFYFFLNRPKKVIHIANLPEYAFYRSIQKGNSQKIHDYVYFVPAAYIKDQYNYCKKELNKFLLKYEQDTTNDEVYCFDYEDILNKYDGENIIIFIDIM